MLRNVCPGLSTRDLGDGRAVRAVIIRDALQAFPGSPAASDNRDVRIGEPRHAHLHPVSDTALENAAAVKAVLRSRTPFEIGQRVVRTNTIPMVDLVPRARRRDEGGKNETMRENVSPHAAFTKVNDAVTAHRYCAAKHVAIACTPNLSEVGDLELAGAIHWTPNGGWIGRGC